MILSAKNLAAWSRGAWQGVSPARIEGVCIDTRRLAPGDLFIALRGETRDGHDFVSEAFDKGACGAVVAKDGAWPETAGMPLLAVGDPAAALRDMAAGYRQAVDPRVIAITGSVGKSTVKEMTAQMLATTFPTARTRENWNNDIGLPLSLLAMQEDVQAGVFELGTNHPGEIEVLCRLANPECGVVTNVGPVHTEFFASTEAIAREKRCLLDCLPEKGLAVLDRDGAFFDLLARSAACEVRTVSFRGEADYSCRGWNPKTRQADIVERASAKQTSLPMPLPGDFNVVNALMAVAVARWMKVAWAGIDEALSHYRGMPMRWQVRDVTGRRIVNDAYNANPMNMRASIRVFHAENGTPAKWLLLAGMLELGQRERDEHLALGTFIAEQEWSGLIVVGDLGSVIAEGATSAGMPADRVLCCADCAEAAALVRQHVLPGSAILVKGSRAFGLGRIIQELAE